MSSEVEQYRIGVLAGWVVALELPEWEVKKITRGTLEGN